EAASPARSSAPYRPPQLTSSLTTVRIRGSSLFVRTGDRGLRRCVEGTEDAREHALLTRCAGMLLAELDEKRARRIEAGAGEGRDLKRHQWRAFHESH